VAPITPDISVIAPDTPEITPDPVPDTEESLKIIAVTNPVSQNETATLSASGKPDTEYSISVYYGSGASSAAGLEPHFSDGSGAVSWRWKIGGSTNSGTFRIVVKGGGEQSETTITVN
jgi:hypothetical protein